MVCMLALGENVPTLDSHCGGKESLDFWCLSFFLVFAVSGSKCALYRCFGLRCIGIKLVFMKECHFYYNLTMRDVCEVTLPKCALGDLVVCIRPPVHMSL
jgi:hypothetical protein